MPTSALLGEANLNRRRSMTGRRSARFYQLVDGAGSATSVLEVRGSLQKLGCPTENQQLTAGEFLARVTAAKRRSVAWLGQAADFLRGEDRRYPLSRSARLSTRLRIGWRFACVGATSEGHPLAQLGLEFLGLLGGENQLSLCSSFEVSCVPPWAHYSDRGMRREMRIGAQQQVPQFVCRHDGEDLPKARAATADSTEAPRTPRSDQIHGAVVEDVSLASGLACRAFRGKAAITVTRRKPFRHGAGKNGQLHFGWR